MATNVLNLTKIENQSILTDVERFNLSEQIRSCVLLLEEKWTAKKLVPELEFSEIDIEANEELLRQVWINLIDNAVKFVDPGGEVKVTIERSEGWLTVSVSDKGPSIPPQERNRIFSKFYQSDHSHAAEGNGIGLAVVKKIVDLHGGKVRAESADGITVFTVTLPEAQ